MTLKELKRLAQNEFSRREFELGEMYEWINTYTYLSVADLVNCIRPIDGELKVDKNYLYSDDTYGYLTAVLATYMEKYIRENLDKWSSKILDD